MGENTGLVFGCARSAMSRVGSRVRCQWDRLSSHCVGTTEFSGSASVSQRGCWMLLRQRSRGRRAGRAPTFDELEGAWTTTNDPKRQASGESSWVEEKRGGGWVIGVV